ncbi:spore germination protein GerW family protein [Clostridium sp. OS1-26]|uniref:GerW family sporulation protein n=1 Tax=Clostridium sp. OS1-26 TaxID=3070681 RepID=UPI0027DF9CC5|nr:spore germination protein GerW family protein [Clostridium sp. OS1-26]WML37366.1 spore germination protein GerW family protein [Clostridium sp. OS1-26]
MQAGSSIPENLEVLFTKLEKFLKTETVVGEPIVIGETTLVPIISVMFGCGTGSGGGTDEKGTNGTGSGLGLGARVVPNAILVIKKDEVTMLPVKGKNNLGNLVEMVPEIISKIDLSKFGKKNSENSNEAKSEEENK